MASWSCRWVLVALAAVVGAGGCRSDGSAGQTDGAPSADSVSPADDAASSPDHGTVVESKWSAIAAGSFTMGSPAGEPCRDGDETAHQVTLTRPFVLSTHEVTQKEFASLMGYNPSHAQSCGDDCPVEWVTWHEAAAYCTALSAAKGLARCYSCSGSGAAVRCTAVSGSIIDCDGYRLPTEAEWEYAARAGTDSALPNGAIASCMTTDKNTGSIAWYKVNSGGGTHPVAQKAANAWGLFDMAGNVYEWTHDRYSHDLGSAAASDPSGPSSGDERVLRGGAWYFNAEHARSANRERFRPDKPFTFVGFRCAKTGGN